MIITKVISLGLDIHNCINIYTDPDNIRQILISRYEGRCISGCYIKEIGRILRMGECIINQDGPPSFGVIPVVFEVTAIIYAVGEIINGCTVMNRDKATGVLICNSDIASIMVSHHPSITSITKGQIISVRVVAAKYNISSTKVAISAIPLLFSNEPMIYKVGAITDTAAAMLANVLERIKYEEEQMEKLKKEKLKAWETFDQLLYAYHEPQPTPKGAKLVDIKTLLKPGTGEIQYISRDSRINLSTPNVYVYPVGSAFPEKARVRADLPIANVYIVLLEDYFSHLRTIREMIEIYSTEELLKEHRNLWQIFKKNKF